MTYSYSRVAGKDPRIIALNRLFVRVKPMYAKYLTDNLGGAWEAGDTRDDNYRSGFRVWERSGENPSQRAYVEFEYWMNTGLRVTGYKGSRAVAHVSGPATQPTPDDMRNPASIMPPSFLKELQDSLGGSYDREKEELASYVKSAEEALAEATKALTQFKKLVANPEKNSEALQEAIQEIAYKGSALEGVARGAQKMLEVIVNKQ